MSKSDIFHTQLIYCIRCPFPGYVYQKSFNQGIIKNEKSRDINAKCVGNIRVIFHTSPWTWLIGRAQFCIFLLLKTPTWEYLYRPREAVCFW